MKKYRGKNRINKIETTSDTLTGRGGLTPFVRYLSESNIYGLLMQKFSFLRKSNKGQAVWNLFLQVFCFFYDGTSRHLSYFDQLKEDQGYAAAIENRPKDMASSHTIKRFFKAFPVFCMGCFRWVLKKIFVWRLKIEKPELIELMIDTMVMNNDEADKRHGVQPTYKKVKGFQPVQIIWNGRIVDAIFRGGKKHGNSGNTAGNMLRDLVLLIRTEYRESVPILVRIDSGFYDERLFRILDELSVGFVASGKMYEGVKAQADAASPEAWGEYNNGRQLWKYHEFGYRGNSWKRFWRAIYTRPVYEDGQGLLEFARPESVILTNIGINDKVLEHATAEQKASLPRAETIIAQHHQRGADELPHRGLKDFCFEQLPFKRFAPNSAFYYCMLISFFLFEAYKEDVLAEVLPITSYATTVRRVALDFAAKIVRGGGGIALKIPHAVMEALKFERLWQRCNNPPPIME
jgi:hypothetical protein